MLHGNTLLLSVFHLFRQNLLCVEVFNSDTDFQQTIYVTIQDLRTFLAESGRNVDLLDDVSRRQEVLEVLFGRLKARGAGSTTTGATGPFLLGFE